MHLLLSIFFLGLHFLGVAVSLEATRVNSVIVFSIPAQVGCEIPHLSEIKNQSKGHTEERTPGAEEYT